MSDFTEEATHNREALYDLYAQWLKEARFGDVERAKELRAMYLALAGLVANGQHS